MNQNENVCNWSSHWEMPHLSPFHFFRGHDDDSRVLLKHHPPEVTDGVLQAALRGDVAPLQFGIVALCLGFRLGITKKISYYTNLFNHSDRTWRHLYYHDGVGIDVVQAWFVRVTVGQHNSCVVDWGGGDRENNITDIDGSSGDSESFAWWWWWLSLTWKNVFISVLVFIFWPLAIFATVEQFTLLLLKRLWTQNSKWLSELNPLLNTLIDQLNRSLLSLALNWVLIGSHLKLFPESLLDLICGLCQLAELSYPSFDLCCIDAGSVQRLQET